jgi:quercetin dioxygenase-like cupin family protein
LYTRRPPGIGTGTVQLSETPLPHLRSISTELARLGDTPIPLLPYDAFVACEPARSAGVVRTEDGGIFVGPADGKALTNPIGGAMMVKVRDSDTAGAYSVHDNTIPPGSPGPRPHLHRDHEEAFYVLKGELTVRVGPRKIVAPAGSFVVVPRGAWRTVPPTRDRNPPGCCWSSPRRVWTAFSRGGRGSRAAGGTPAHGSGGPGEARGLHGEVRLRVRGAAAGGMRAAHTGEEEIHTSERPRTPFHALG